MSEYQYYEFRAIDPPLTPEQMSELRELSSRAEITQHSFEVTYNYGDFRGDPRKLMEKYFDGHIYVSNFGTITFLLRLPHGVLSDETIEPYASEESLDWWNTDKHTIVEWQLNEDGSSRWMEGDGWLDRLLPLRDELIRGDYRSLYIGWLSSFAGRAVTDDEDEDEDGEEDDDDLDDDEEEYEDDFVPYSKRKEPPVPAGLGSLTSAQEALTEYLGVGVDLVTVAAEASSKLSKTTNSVEKATDWVARLPEAEVRAAMVRILNGEGMRVQTELQSRYYRSIREANETSETKSGKSRRTAAQLLQMAEKAEAERKLSEKREKDRKRSAFLKGLVPRLPEMWTKVDALAAEQKATPYGQACELLVDMRAAYGLAGRSPEFDAEFARFLGKYSRSTALVRRLKEAKLIK